MKQFLNTAEAAEQFGISPASARVLFHGVRDNIPERYRDLDIIGRKQVAIRAVALMDYSRYGDNLRTAPPYRPLESANKAARTEALAKLLLDSEEEQRKLRHKVVALEWLIKQNEQFARIGRAVIKWRNRHE